jgi:GT2 family glycosyltransferase
MSRVPAATIVIVARDRWSQAPAALDDLLARSDPSYPVVVVDGAAPTPVAGAFERAARTGRVRVSRRERFLASNEARNVGADGIRTEWIAFVENDTSLSTGWLDRLLSVGEEKDATAVYPAFLLGDDDPCVHGLGSELTVTGPAGSQRLRERQHRVGERWHDVAPGLVPVERLQPEPHALVLRRSFLEAMGGFDEQILSWFDHVDVALHLRRLAGTAWLVPDVTCTYHPPPPAALSDLATFALRWGRPWYRASLRHLCAVWGLDPEDPQWEAHERYRRSVRSSVPTRWPKLNGALGRASVPLEWAIERSWAKRRPADARLGESTSRPRDA